MRPGPTVLVRWAPPSPPPGTAQVAHLFAASTPGDRQSARHATDLLRNMSRSLSREFSAAQLPVADYRLGDSQPGPRPVRARGLSSRTSTIRDLVLREEVVSPWELVRNPSAALSAVHRLPDGKPSRFLRHRVLGSTDRRSGHPCSVIWQSIRNEVVRRRPESRSFLPALLMPARSDRGSLGPSSNVRSHSAWYHVTLVSGILEYGDPCAISWIQGCRFAGRQNLSTRGFTTDPGGGGLNLAFCSYES